MIFKFITIKPLLNHSSVIYYNYRNYCNRLELKPPWKVLFFGNDQFSLESLKALRIEQKVGDLLGNLEVVTSMKKKKNPVEQYALAENLVVHDFANGVFNCNQFHIGLVVSFGHLIPAKIINSFHFGMLNVHASLLPRWRGAAPIVHAIARGDLTTGVTIMRVKAGKFDIGEIVKQESVEIPPHMRMPELYNILAKLGSKNLVSTLKNLSENIENAIPQPVEGVTLAPKIDSKMSLVDWSQMSSISIYNLDRALAGFLQLTTKLNDVPVKLYEITRSDYSETSTTVAPGFITYNKSDKALCVQCADGNWLNVEKIGIPGKKISASDFNNGFLNKLPLELRVFR